jgi:tRNA A37 N6-isopentenylltransferase MiaA
MKAQKGCGLHRLVWGLSRGVIKERKILRSHHAKYIFDEIVEALDKLDSTT